MSEEGYVLVAIAGVHGILCEFPMLASSTFWDLKYLIKEVLHVQKRDQKLVSMRWTFGGAWVRRCLVKGSAASPWCENQHDANIAVPEPVV